MSRNKGTLKFAFTIAQVLSAYLTFSLLTTRSDFIGKQLKIQRNQIIMQGEQASAQFHQRDASFSGVIQSDNDHVNAALSRDVQAAFSDKAFQVDVASGIHQGALTPDGLRARGTDGRVLGPLEQFSAIGHLTPIREHRIFDQRWYAAGTGFDTSRTPARIPHGESIATQIATVGPASWQWGSGNKYFEPVGGCAVSGSFLADHQDNVGQDYVKDLMKEGGEYTNMRGITSTKPPRVTVQDARRAADIFRQLAVQSDCSRPRSTPGAAQSPCHCLDHYQQVIAKFLQLQEQDKILGANDPSGKAKSPPKRTQRLHRKMLEKRA